MCVRTMMPGRGSAVATVAMGAIHAATVVFWIAYFGSFFFGMELAPVTAYNSPWGLYVVRGEICMITLLDNERKISKFGQGYKYIEIDLESAADARRNEILYALSARYEAGGKNRAFAGFLLVDSNSCCAVLRVPAYAVAALPLGLTLFQVYHWLKRRKRNQATV